MADELRAQFGASTTLIAKDLSQPAAADEVAGILQESGVDVHVLINNAGYAMWGPFVETSLEDELRMVQVNVVALTSLAKLVLRDMVKRGSGRVMNVASTAAFQPGPLMAVYYASKAYVLSFSEALVEELRGTGVTVTALCPGLTRTGFQRRAGIEHTRLVAAGMMDAKTVAERGYRGMMRGEDIVIPGFRNQFFAELASVAPRSWVRRVVRRLQEARHT